MTELKIQFDNPQAAEHFASWLCGQGEQDYWQWMEYREREERGPVTVTSFHYHGPDYAEGIYTDFMEDGIIRTTCGRRDGVE